MRNLSCPATTTASISRRMAVFATAFAAVVLAGCASLPSLPFASAPKPPIAKQVPYTVTSPNGDRVDPYYWLRDDTRQSNDVLDYLKAENAYRDAVMAHTAPLQQKLYDEMVARQKPDDATVPVWDNGYWYYSRFEPGKEHAIQARRQGQRDAPEEVLIDGNARAIGASFYSLGGLDVSPDGQKLAFTEDLVGRRQYVIKVKDLATGELLPDVIENAEPDVLWAADGKTLLYIEKDPVTLLSTRVKRHRLGTLSVSDIVVHDEKDTSYYLSLSRASSGKMLFINLTSTLQSEVRYAYSSDARLAFKPVLPREAGHLYKADHDGRDFIVLSNWKAQNFRVLRAPVKTSSRKGTWKEVLPTRRDVLIDGFEIHQDALALNERADGLLKLRVHPWKAGTSLKQDVVIAADEPAYTMDLVETPGITGPGGAQKLRYRYSSLITPATTYDYDLKTGQRELLKRTEVLGGFDSANYQTEFRMATARDGTKVPVSLAYRRGTPLDGTAPLYQYGYGSYGFSSDPRFHSDWLSLLDRGFVVAIAHVRGGQELGRAWYEHGKLLEKKNSFTDFIDVTAFLTLEKIAAADKVFAEGRSAGGLLMGAVLNLAPERYRGVVAGVPFVDVVTTMLDESIPLTTNEFDEWGNPKQKAYYDYMLSYSPYDNIRPQAYPAIYVHTGLWDSQVQYYEPAKWVAKLRAMKTDQHPLIFSIDLAAGHGGKAGRYERHHETARSYAFILDQIGITQ